MKNIDQKTNQDLDFSTRICLPIEAITEEKLFVAAKKAMQYSPDYIEWRVDAFQDHIHINRVLNSLKNLRTILENTPLIFTLRSVSEGGKSKLKEKNIKKLHQAVIESGSVDYLDIEYCLPKKLIKKQIKHAHKNNVQVILSAHYFKKMPKIQYLKKQFKNMHSLNPDITKIAVMPKKIQKVLSFMQLAQQMSKEMTIIAIAMGKEGVITRVLSQEIGSYLTFACLDKASAPGQISIKKLRKLIQIGENAIKI